MEKFLSLCAWILLFPLYKAVQCLPLMLIYKITRLCGFLFYLVPMFRNNSRANLKVVFPEKSASEIDRIARESVANVFMIFAEFLWFADRIPLLRERSEMDERIHRYLVDAGRNDVNVLMVTPHIGNWEIAGLFCALFTGRNLAVVARTIRNPHFDDIVNNARRVVGNRVIPAKGAVKKMLQALKDKFILVTLIDQNTRVRDGGIFVNYLGLPVPVSRVPAMFARKFNTEIVVAGAVRKAPGRYMAFLEPLHKPSSAYESDEELIQDVLNLTESVVRKYPEQYIWFYKRFQYIPAEASEELKSKYPFYSEMATERFYSKPAARKGQSED